MIDVLAPRSAFVGEGRWQVAALLPDFMATWPWWEVGLFVAVAWFAVSVLAVCWWFWYINRHDSRTSYQKWLDRKQSDADEIEYLEEQERKKRERKKRKEKP